MSTAGPLATIRDPVRLLRDRLSACERLRRWLDMLGVSGRASAIHAIGTYPTSLRAGKLDRKKLPKSSDAPKLPAFHASDDYQRVVCACF